MKFRTLMRHIRVGCRNIIRNGWMTIASIGAVTTTLILVSVFLALVLNLNEIAKNIENDVEIKTLVELGTSEEEVIALGKQLEEIEGVESVTFSSNDEELQGLIDSMGEEGETWELFEQDNPLNHAFVVRAEVPQDTEKIAKEIQSFDNINKVVFGKDVVKQLFEFNNYARVIGIALIVALVFTAIFLISNTIKITIIARSTEIGIMKLVGATNGFIRWPFFIEGLLLGVLGSVIPIAIVLGGYYYLDSAVIDTISFSFVELLPFNPFAWQLSLLVLAIGAIIGVWGSVMSIRKYLKV
ncbi:FtsX-like permease family protein [Oceanobacillus sp. 143]|uniref:Cell division protein FtsX n=1 Tax=Oceanobacillus zhaokaii TaxID=2052660 RepID=A0A345PJ25_9BACI|nr:permease-like cell division protein FtsX [Oceanobacillus zhaokaii]AXI10005.1 cell division protein FtsX [Oceanobacillus zhaokaii]QGS69171.1 FtsX-like permease family protein [Oceanobacillus sp. 143]